jgi:hypothetical protein
VPPLHITNGDSAGDKLRRIVDGTVTITADVLHEGPAPRVDGDAWYDTRARFLAAYGSERELKDQLAAWDRTVAEAVARGDAIVLWFEHDLFDQLLLIRTLDLIGDPERVALHRGRTPDSIGDPALRQAQGIPSSSSGERVVLPGNVSLICIDRFPGVERFIGLGQLTPDQLATLIGTERPVTAEQYTIARDAWNAFRSSDPRDLLAVAGRAEALPFLGDALRRFFAEYPSTWNGLSRTEQLALDALAGGPATGGDLFVETQRHEARPFMGDLGFFDILRALAAARVPMVTIDGQDHGLDLRRLHDRDDRRRPRCRSRPSRSRRAQRDRPLARRCPSDGHGPQPVAVERAARNVGIMSGAPCPNSKTSHCTRRAPKPSPTTCGWRSNRSTRPSTRSPFRTSGSSTTPCVSRTRGTKRCSC